MMKLLPNFPSSSRENHTDSRENNSRSGQSLIEVTFASAVVALVLVAILSTVILSVQNARFATEQSQSTELAREALEWTRSQRDQEGWGVFFSGLQARGNSQTYCLATLPASFTALLSQSLGACNATTFVPGTQMRREIQLQLNVGTPQTVTITSEVIRQGKSGEVPTILQMEVADWN